MNAAYAYEKREVLLVVDDVHLSFGGRPVIRSFKASVKNIVRPDMQQGQVVGLLGPSGIGKTQLFRIIAGLQAPDQGGVLLARDGAPEAVTRGGVGLVAQDYPLFEHRTVLDNLARAASVAGASRREAVEKALHTLGRFGLSDKVDAYPRHLSGGQRQRAAIAQQVVRGCRLLLMDEPFTGLDPPTVESVCHFISEVAQMDERFTLIVSSHILSASVMVSDTLWLMGRERTAEGQVVPGAFLKEEIDLIQRGLAWHPDVLTTQAFSDTVAEIRATFPSL